MEISPEDHLLFLVAVKPSMETPLLLQAIYTKNKSRTLRTQITRQSLFRPPSRADLSNRLSGHSACGPQKSIKFCRT